MAGHYSKSFDSDNEIISDVSSHLEESFVINDSDPIIIEESDEQSINTSKPANNEIINDSDKEDSDLDINIFTKSRKRITVLDSFSDININISDSNKENDESSVIVDQSSSPMQKNNIQNKSSILEVSDESGKQNIITEQNEESNSSVEDLLALIHKYNEDLKKSEFILKSTNFLVLPDKGKKIKDSISFIKWKISNLNKALENKLALQESEVGKIQMEDASSPAFNRKTEPHNEYDFKRTDIKKEQPDELAFLSKPTESTDINNFGKKAQQTFENQQALTMERLETLHGSLTSQPGENVLAPDPRGLKVELMDHQKHALAWLSWRETQNPAGGILADDMGLGKTLTMISLILASNDLNEDESSDDEEYDMVQKIKKLKYFGGTLVVCPASLLQQWDKEIETRCKKHLLDVLVFHGNSRETKPRRIARVDVVITTYDTLASERKKNSTLFQIRWKRVILDEAHVIRNNKSLKCEAVCNLIAKKRWALTGTPIQNKEGDLYSIMKFLQCSPFDDIRVWKRWVDNKNEAGTKRLATVLKSIMLRRTKKELQDKGKLESMPEKFVDTIQVELTSTERVVYQKLLLYSQTLFAQFLHQQAEKKHMNDLYGGKFDHPTYSLKETQFNKAQRKLLHMHGGSVMSHEILVLLLRLRQICCHPNLIKAMLDKEDLETNGVIENEDANDDLLSKLNNMTLEEDTDLNESIGVDKAVMENVLTSENPIFNDNTISSKVKVALDVIKDVIEKKEKIVVISQWTSFLDLLGKNLDQMKGFSYDMFTGKVAVKKRQEVIEKFNKRHKDPQILLLSLTAGGVGLNLTGANHLLVLDIHWNPQLELQAHDRVYRFGQDKQVYVHRLLCKDTIEERVQNLQEKKLNVADNVLHGKNVSTKLTIDDLKMLFS